MRSRRGWIEVGIILGDQGKGFCLLVGWLVVLLEKEGKVYECRMCCPVPLMLFT